MAKIRLTVEPTEGKTKLVELPDDWEDMDQLERTEYLLEESADFLLSEVKHYGKVE